MVGGGLRRCKNKRNLFPLFEETSRASNEGGRGRRIIENTNRANKNNGRKHLGIYCETCRFFASFFLFTYTCFSTLHDTGNLALTDGLYVHIRGRIIFHERHKKYFIRFIRKIDFSNFWWKCSICVSSLWKKWNTGNWNMYKCIFLFQFWKSFNFR